MIAGLVRRPGVIPNLAPLAVFGISTAGLVAVMGFQAGAIRFVLAGLLLLDLGVIYLRAPQLAIATAVCLSIVIPLIRRVLIPSTGLTTYDPLLLVTPGFALFVLGHCFLTGRARLLHDHLSVAVMVLLAITLLEVVNPAGDGIAAGVTGLLYVAVPPLWFFVGRAYGEQRFATALVVVVLCTAVLDSVYGLWQTLIGFPPWDAQWAALVSAGSYAALNVGGVIRAWGTLSSSAEYATLLGIGIMVATALALRGRLAALLATPFLIWALILESSRGAVVYVLAAVVAMSAMRTRGAWARAGIVLLALALVVVAQRVLASGVNSGSLASSNALIAHELGGLANPLDPTQSTFVQHLALVGNAFVTSLAHPLGLGTAATNLAGVRTTAAASSTSEFDISDAFQNLGLLGGLTYVFVVMLAFTRCIRACLRLPGFVTLAILGIMVVSFGQWLNGGLYATAPLVWLCIGMSDRMLLDVDKQASTGVSSKPPLTT